VARLQSANPHSRKKIQINSLIQLNASTSTAQKSTTPYTLNLANLQLNEKSIMRSVSTKSFQGLTSPNLQNFNHDFKALEVTPPGQESFRKTDRFEGTDGEDNWWQKDNSISDKP